MKDYYTSIIVHATAHEAFDAINNVRGWWTENLEGSSEKLNDEFTVRFDDVHVSTQKLVEVIPGKKVTWLVTYSRLNFIQKKDEWTNTKIVFEIAETDGKTKVDFTHIGLDPSIECFDACSNAWAPYIQHSLAGLINTGKGQPTKKENKENVSV